MVEASFQGGLRGWAVGLALIGGCFSNAPDVNTSTSAASTSAASTSAASTSAASTSAASTEAEATTAQTGTTGGASSGSDDETTVSDPVCANDPRACTVWVLPHGGGATWTALGGDQVGSNLGPSQRVRAAFDIEAHGIAFVLTDSTYHRFDLRSQSWTEVGPRENLFPELGDSELVRGHSIPAYWVTMFTSDKVGISRVILGSATQRFSYEYNLSDGNFSFQSATTNLRFWPESAPNSVALAQVEATWSDVTNDPGWISEDEAMAQCPKGSMPEVAVGAYLGIVAAGEVAKRVRIPCLAFLPAETLGLFAPFTRDNSPPQDVIHGAAYSELFGLFVFQ